MSPDKTLFERMGGAEGIAELVREMYARVQRDPELAPFFEKVSMDRLVRMQYQFMASALDGPSDYTGAELTQIHCGRGITAKHFASFCGHFADAAEQAGVDKSAIDNALGRLATYKDKITGDTMVDG
ncbi:MAG: group 1 truncated hemoglobin [Rubripirellula sp.]|nr:group 1 truncated hemoglobin [Rubripirellula sp.]